NPSISRPTGRTQTTTPAVRVDAPSAMVASRDDLLRLCRIHLAATTTGTSATTPYTTAVAMIATPDLPKPDEPAEPGKAAFIRQNRLNTTASAARAIDV